MYFYRTLNLFHAVTVDLDNTLYKNDPVICKAEEKVVSFLQQYHPALFGIQREDCFLIRKILLMIDPNICHDVNYWRWKALEIMLLQSGISKSEAQIGADRAMEIIIYWRNKINISYDTHKILSDLSNRWPLIAITNGNADPRVYGLQKYFYDVLRAGVNGRSKPYTDMYKVASKRLGIPCKSILHIGDDLNTDILGANRAGLQTCWINKNRYKLSDCIDKKYFPNLEISELTALENL